MNRSITLLKGLHFSLFAFFWSLTVHSQVPAPRPMAEMNGNCGDYSWNLTEELAQWENDATERTSGLEEPLGTGTLYQLQLVSAEGVERTLPPNDKKARSFDFAGAFSWTPEKDGVYRISASRKVWLDLVDAQTKQLIPSASFEMQVQCASIFKSVAFELQSGRELILQIQSSTPRSVDVLISPWRERKGL